MRSRLVSLALPIALPIALFAAAACVRVYDEAKPDAGGDAGVEVAVTPSACDKYGGYAGVQPFAASIVDALVADCRIGAHFKALPADRVPHVRECIALQLASILQCSRDGVRMKYPAVDSKGVLCRDMRSSHAGNGLTSGDFDAFVDVVHDTLSDAKMNADDLARVTGVLGNPFNRKDISESPSSGLSRSTCDAGTLDATSEAAADAGEVYDTAY